MKHIKSYGAFVTALFAGVLLPVQSAYAVDAMQMLINISAQVAPIEKMITGGAYIIGLGFVFRAIYALKMYGQNMTMMSQQNSLKTPMAYFFVGAMLIWLPTAMAIMMQTTFGSDSILAYSTNNSSYYGQSLKTILRLVQLIGVISFIRGWVILAQASGQGGHQGVSFGKALTHIFGGVLAVNIYGFLKVLGSTTGIDVGF